MHKEMDISIILLTLCKDFGKIFFVFVISLFWFWQLILNCDSHRNDDFFLGGGWNFVA